MNTVQRATLIIMLIIDWLMILFPPFQRRIGGGYIYFGHHWLLWGDVNPDYHPTSWIEYIDQGSLMSEIVIVTIVGFTVLVLGREIHNEWLRIAGKWVGIGLGIICASVVAGVVIAAFWP